MTLSLMVSDLSIMCDKRGSFCAMICVWDIGCNISKCALMLNSVIHQLSDGTLGFHRLTYLDRLRLIETDITGDFYVHTGLTLTDIYLNNITILTITLLIYYLSLVGNCLEFCVGGFC